MLRLAARRLLRVEYLHLAGQQAVQRSANEEAVEFVTAAVKLLTGLPDTPDRARRELDLQLTLGPALMMIKGFTAPELEIAYLRARTLCQQLGETSALFPVLHGLFRFHVVRGELQTAAEMGEQLLTLAQAQGDSTLLVEPQQVQLSGHGCGDIL